MKLEELDSKDSTGAMARSFAKVYSGEIESD